MDTKIRFLDNCLLIDREILVFSDFHIGYEESVFGKEFFLRVQLKENLEKLEEIFSLLDKEKIKIKEIVILGDLKHEFGQISDAEWRETLELIDYFLKKTKKIVLIKGNHDNILGPIAEKRGIGLKEHYKRGEICFLHGDKLNEKCLNESKVLIMGHLHPAIVLYDGYKKEKYKCFLKGKWKEKEVYILPSFAPLSLGYDINEIMVIDNKDASSIIKSWDLRNFQVIVYNSKENKEYNFGKLKKLMESL